eukprot:CAMPEP_0170241584 /NCGR_PEP_ID=MMETSP0116_2-20130129/20562_1 /TAXON_ID=400756 /ORGANISM="Durinskia baltica, Strain CSIRO CS-38" /LENGTH=214 /DNA_ID=CAMNT_0010492427 /DNA_START=44 /DNA_END=684 /DNA_ORIENTATION=-
MEDALLRRLELAERRNAMLSLELDAAVTEAVASQDALQACVLEAESEMAAAAAAAEERGASSRGRRSSASSDEADAVTFSLTEALQTSNRAMQVVLHGDGAQNGAVQADREFASIPISEFRAEVARLEAKHEAERAALENEVGRLRNELQKALAAAAAATSAASASVDSPLQDSAAASLQPQRRNLDSYLDECELVGAADGGTTRRSTGASSSP